MDDWIFCKKIVIFHELIKNFAPETVKIWGNNWVNFKKMSRVTVRSKHLEKQVNNWVKLGNMSRNDQKLRQKMGKNRETYYLEMKS